MKNYISHSLLRWSFGAFLLAALPARAIQYPPGIFDIEITLGCDCSCCCSTNSPASNNPIGMFLATNPITDIMATSFSPTSPQYVPPHWTEFMGSCTVPYDANATIHTFQLEGWTETQSQCPANGFTPYSSVNFSLCGPVDFTLPFNFYADALPPLSPPVTGDPPIAVQPLGQSACQPYPWYINSTMYLLNGQVYQMEQQLAVGYFPEEGPVPPLNTLVDIVETNSLLNITLLCTNNMPIQLYYANITATLDGGIPTPPSDALPGVFSFDLFTNWTWPFTPADAPDPNGPEGSAGTVQASLNINVGFPSMTTIQDTALLVRANRSYTITIDPIYVVEVVNGTSYAVSLPGTSIVTGLLAPCTMTNIVLYLDYCSEPPNTNTGFFPCTNSGITGTVNMLGPPSPGTTIDVAAFAGPYGQQFFATPLAAQGPYQFNFMVGSDAFLGPPYPPGCGNGVPYKMQATMDLNTFSGYEYFASPILGQVYADCGCINDLTNVFVMCSNNPGIVQGSICMCGPVDTNYYGGVPALSVLQFAQYDANGLPHDPLGSSNPFGSDPSLQNNNAIGPFTVNYNSFSGEFLSYIQATGGLTAGGPPLASPLVSLGLGSATTEFDNPGGFFGPNNYCGNYSLEMAGLEGQASFWSPNVLHLVFGAPVNLTYDVTYTTPPYNNLNIACGTITTNDIDLCFGLTTIGVTNLFPNINNIYVKADITLSGSGPSSGPLAYTVGPITFNNFMFSPATSTIDVANIPLFLPSGNYQYTATVINSLGQGINLNITNTFTINCSCSNSFTNVPVCCTNCFPPYPDSYIVTVYPGSNFLADDLCQGTNNTVAALLPNVPNLTEVFIWDNTLSPPGYDPAAIFSTKHGWVNGTETLSPGEGFILINPTTSNFTLTISGCPPDCPLPCEPSNGCSLVGGYGTNTCTWSNLFSCPPLCGTEFITFNPMTQQFTTNVFAYGVWSLGPPVLPVGQSAWVCENPAGLVVICPTNKTEPCGSNWTFDMPMAYSCCPSNLTTNVISTVTNGIGQITFTGSGSTANAVVEFAGNTAISGYLNITAGTNVGTYTLSPGSGSNGFFQWDNMIFPGSDPFIDYSGLLFTNGGVDINLFGNGPGSYTLAGAPPAYEPDVTNGTAIGAFCSQMITRTWLFTDGCGDSNTCSQTVTVLNANLPVLTCASNLTVSSGQGWNFTPPMASEACCTNLTIIVSSTVTNVSFNPCEINYTRTWQVTDCCSNTATCSQTVTVIPTGPCQVFNTGISGTNALAGDATDPNFALVSEPAGAFGNLPNAVVIYPADVPGNYLSDGPNSQWIGPDPYASFSIDDEPAGVYHYQLQFLLCCTNGAELSGQMAADNTAGVYLNGGTHEVGSISTSSSFSSWTPISITSGFVVGINVLDIYVTNYGASPTDTSPSPTAFRAEFTNCVLPLAVYCPSNKTVQCGSGWMFDLPVATSCCGSNVTILSTHIVTNGTCPQYITNSWIIYDNCGNTNYCSQVVTVQNTNPPVINCPSNIVVMACTNVPVCYNVTASNACCTNVTVVCTPPSCSTFVPGTVTTVNCVATDCCGNSNTCSFTVTVNPCLAPPTNMVLWLPFDEKAGPTSANLASPANSGTQVGGPAVVLGAYVDNSLQFFGAQHVTVPNYPGIVIGTNDFTIDAWVTRATNGPNSSPCVIVDKRDTNTGAGYSLSLSNGALVLSAGGNPYVDTGAHIVQPNGNSDWHFIAVSVSQSTGSVLFYIDGHVNSTVALTPGDVSNTHPLWVGASDYGDNSQNQPWQGDIDEVEVFSRALSTNELGAICSASTCGKCKPCCYLETLTINFVSRNTTPPTVAVTWAGCGTLQSATSVAGPWSDVPGATSPHTIPATGVATFYKLRCN